MRSIGSLHIDLLPHNLLDRHIQEQENRLNFDRLDCSCERIDFVVAEYTQCESWLLWSVNIYYFAPEVE